MRHGQPQMFDEVRDKASTADGDDLWSFNEGSWPSILNAIEKKQAHTWSGHAHEHRAAHIFLFKQSFRNVSHFVTLQVNISKYFVAIYKINTKKYMIVEWKESHTWFFKCFVNKTL